MKCGEFLLLALSTSLALPASPQKAASNIAASAPTPVPALIPYSGVVESPGSQFPGQVAATFQIFDDEQGGEPLFAETQLVAIDATGHYRALLGATFSNGMPLDLFASGEARWLEVQIAGQRAGPRVLLASVPYALKAADATTLGGMPASAFALAAPALSKAGTSSGITGVTAGTGLVGGGNSGNVTLALDTTKVPLLAANNGFIGNEIVSGTVAASSAGPFAIAGTDTSPSGNGVYGVATTGNGVVGAASGSGGSGVFGYNTSSTGSGIGVSGQSVSIDGIGVRGYVDPANGLDYHYAYGVLGIAAGLSIRSAGVNGTSVGAGSGVVGTTSNIDTYGVSGTNQGTGVGVKGVSSGVAGLGNTGGIGVLGESSAIGLLGRPSTAIGVEGSVAAEDRYGVYGYNGATTGSAVGVYGATSSTSSMAAGVEGTSNIETGSANGVLGTSSSPNGVGVYGYATPSFTPGGSPTGVFGQSDGYSGIGVKGLTTINGGIPGLFINQAGSVPILEGQSGAGSTTVFNVDSKGTGYFAGDLHVLGNLSKGGGSFKIDDPLDPANKYLSHSFVESPDMMDVYNGNVTTDRHGRATVDLPEYFEALNRDFRYQLTVMGQFAQAIVATKIGQNRFVIRTDKPSVEVSWQVTGVRKDAYANANRISVEEEKPVEERGYYLYPELFDQPASKSIVAAHRSGGESAYEAQLHRAPGIVPERSKQTAPVVCAAR